MVCHAGAVLRCVPGSQPVCREHPNKMTDFRTTERYRKMIKSGCLPDKLLILRRLKEAFHIGRARD